MSDPRLGIITNDSVKVGFVDSRSGLSTDGDVTVGGNTSVSGDLSVGGELSVTGDIVGLVRNQFSASIRSTARSAVGAATVTVPYDTEEFDTSPNSNMVDLASNQITIRQTGYYHIYSKIYYFGLPAGDSVQLRILVEGDRYNQKTFANGSATPLDGTLDVTFFGLLNSGEVVTCEINTSDTTWDLGTDGASFANRSFNNILTVNFDSVN